MRAISYALFWHRVSTSTYRVNVSVSTADFFSVCFLQCCQRSNWRMRSETGSAYINFSMSAGGNDADHGARTACHTWRRDSLGDGKHDQKKF